MKIVNFCLLIVMFSTVVWEGYGQCGCSSVPAGYGQCITVTSTSDASVCGTLRYAIEQANAYAGSNGTYISFDFSSNPASEIIITIIGTDGQGFFINKKMMIDGTTSPGKTIIVEGTGIRTIKSAFYVSAPNSTIKGLTIRNFWDAGIIIYNPDPVVPQTNISILNNTLYNIVGSDQRGCLHIYGYNNQNVYIYGNIFNGYKNASGQLVSYTPRNRPIALFPGANNGSNPISVLKNIQIGSGNEADKNIFFIYDYGIYNYEECSGINKIEQFSVKYNLFYDGSVDARNIFALSSNGASLTCHKLYNNNKKVPVISRFDLATDALIGTSSPGDRIEIYTNTSAPANPSKYLGVVIANGSGQWSLPKSSWPGAPVVLTDTTYFFAIADSLGNSSPFVSHKYVTCPPVTIIAPPVVCKGGDPVLLIGAPGAAGTITGSCGSCVTSGWVPENKTVAYFNPAGLSPGTYTVTFEANMWALPLVSTGYTCATTASKQILIPSDATFLQNVINISAGTFNDAWPVDADIPASSAGYGYGMRGVKYMWAPEDQYAYVDDRVQSNTLTSRKDGLLQNVPMFDWNNIASNSCYANWRKVNTITEINSGTGQLENKDILNNYSAALYGYNDQLSTAVASNASYKELAFDSFEEYKAGRVLNLDTLLKSNLTLVTTTPVSGTLSSDVHFSYEIIQAANNELTIVYPASLISTLSGKRVGVFGASLTENTKKVVQGYYDIQSAQADGAAGTAKVTLNTADFNYPGLIWSGKITVPTKVSDPSHAAVFNVPTSSVSIVNTFPSNIDRRAHSGKNALKVTSSAEMEQVNLRLTEGKEYVIGAWLSTDDADADTYASGLDRGLQIVFMDASGSVIAPAVANGYTFVPSGLIIEGWQRLEASVVVPAGAVRFTIRFNTPANTATYYDDIRFFPSKGNMQSYVYDNMNYKLMSVLDQNNYATYYYYNEEGALYLVKKETESGVQTLQEVYMHYTEINK